MLVLAVVLRAGFFAWGLYQDANMLPKFTDVDYMVFTDAAQFVYSGLSPYFRETYRYTPLLSWLLVPTVWLFCFGKILFMLGDLVAGYLMLQIFRRQHISSRDACIFSSLWLLNPMVAVISTRGSSEGLLGAMIIYMLWAVYEKRYWHAGCGAGLAIHFKIYPIIYVPTIIWALGPLHPLKFINRARLQFALGTLVSFAGLTGLMYAIYGSDYLQHSWLHHLTRIDHRHNFSPYATVLYYASADPASAPRFESWAFVPQLFLSGVLLPLVFARRDIAKTMFVQTFAFVAFNKVCTSQYFLWYLVLLPFYVPSLKKAGVIKYVFAALWVGAQGMWLHYGFQLEFLGVSTFYPQLFAATLLFFIVNIWGTCLLIRWF